MIFVAIMIHKIGAVTFNRNQHYIFAVFCRIAFNFLKQLLVGTKWDLLPQNAISFFFRYCFVEFEIIQFIVRKSKVEFVDSVSLQFVGI